jgi:hypothetical protein
MITVYTAEGRDGKEDEGFSTRDYEEARAYAQERTMRVIANEFVFAGSYPLDDFTGQLTDDEQFFYDHADYSPDPGTRTADENQRRRARELATAEQLLNRCPAAWITWDDEDNPDTDEYRQYQAVLWVQLGTAPGQDKAALLASAECVAAGPDTPYRRVVEAQLANEAREALDAL